MQKTTTNRQRAFLPIGPVLGLLLIFVFSQAFSQSVKTTTNCPRMQHQADLWYFGERAGIDFRSGTAFADTTQNVMTAYKSSAVMCDSAGNLLFFTNGTKVWDREFNVMTNASGLDGDLGVTQPCIIVPKSDDPTIYFIFTLDVMAFKPDNTYTTNGMRYSIVDMKLRGGLGDASVLNLQMLNPATQKLTAVLHKDKRSVWVIAHAWNSDQFYAYLATDDGVHEPVISSSGTVHGGGASEQTNAYGAMKASPDGKSIALAISGKNLIEWFDFNNETGVVSNGKSVTTTEPGVNPYGIEFSPDSRKLYATLLQIVGNGPPTRPSFIYQFDLDNTIPAPVLIDSVSGVRVSDLQLASDGRIYAARTINLLSKKDSLDVIYNPNRPGTACNFNQLDHLPGSRFALLGRAAMFSLPNFIQSYFDLPAFQWDSVCKGDVTRFTITNTANTDSVFWSFGDGGTSTSMEPLHAYAQPGDYQVKLTSKFNGVSYTDSALVKSYALPVIGLGDTILLYSGSSINLHAGGGFMEYTWSTNSHDSIISVASQGNYWAQVKDFNCCVNSDSVYVKVFEYFIPNAFTPNGDGLNDVFRVVGLYKNIDFKMYLYNRWGQLLFESDDIDKGWDGTSKGLYCEPGSYVWILNVSFLGQDIITQGDIVLKGTVTLVR